MMDGFVVPDASLLTIKQRQIDQRIDYNTQEIEECLENIENLLSELPVADNASHASTLEDQLDCITKYHIIEKTACYDLDFEELQGFFAKMNDFLTANPGSEEFVLSMLLRLCSHTGLTLPWKLAGQDGQRSSMMSLNVVNDEDEQMCEALWDEVRRALEDYVVACLFRLPVTDDNLVIRWNRSEYIDKLHLLISTRQLCNQYRSLRVCSLNQMINEQLSSEGGAPTFKKIIDAFVRISDYVITMIDGDFHLLISGIFKKISTTFEIISSIYFDKLTDELESVLDDLATEIYGQVDSRLTSRRQSDFALADKLKEKITKTKSKSKKERLSSVGGASSIEADVHLDNEVARSIVRLAKALNAVDQRVYNMYLMSYTGLRGTSAHSLQSAERIRGVLKSTSVTDISILSDSLTSDTSDLPSLLHSGRLHYQTYDKAPQVVDKPIHHDKPLFLWQQSLKRFVSDLSLFVEVQINNAAEECITALSSSGEPDTIKLCPSHRGSKMEYPVSVWKAVSNFIIALESVFPLAQAGHTLLPVRQTFISTTMAWSKTLLETFHVVVDSTVQVTAGNSKILTALSSIALLRNTLYQCESMLSKDSSEKHNTFVLVYHQTCQAVDALAQQYVTLEVDMVNNALLHDVESYNWSENKEFFESERCSFPVQTWSYHLQMIRLELWGICPPSNASSIYSDILRQTLDNLTLRYLNEYPSYRRTEQYRMDVAVILHTVYELMFYVCSTPSQLLNIESIAFEQPYLTIHSSCCKLLASAAVVTSPLEELYKVYKKGYRRKSRRRRQSPDFVEDEAGYYSHWLSWIQPDIMPKGITRVSDMQTTTALYTLIKLMLSQPEPQWSMLIQVITMKDFTLPIMILTQSNLDVTPSQHPADPSRSRDNAAYQPSAEELSPSTTAAQCQLAFCDGSCYLSDIANLFKPFLMILLKCNKPTALYQVLLPVINRANQWDMLNPEMFYQNMQQHNVPKWFAVISEVIGMSILPTIKSTMLLVHQTLSQLQSGGLDTQRFIHSLPCGCELGDELNQKSDVNWHKVIAESVLVGLTEGVSRLPISLCILLEKLGENVHKLSPSHTSDSVILQILGFTASQCLTNTKFLEECNNGKLSVDVLTKLQHAAVCVYASLSKGSDQTGLQLTREQMKYLTESHHWLEEQRHIILCNIKQRESLWPDLDVDGGTAETFAEFATISIASEILESPKGENYMRQIHNVIANNQEWLFSSMDIHGSLPEVALSEGAMFTPDVCDHTDKRTDAKLNPLTLYNRIGDSAIDFEVIKNQTQTWTGLLHCDLGVSDLALSAMLQHRHDFQDVSYLETNEKKHVESLKAKFNISSLHE